MNKSVTIIDNIVTIGQKGRPEIETEITDLFFRWISKYFTYVFVKLNISPNTVTIVAIFNAILGGVLLSNANNSIYLILSGLCFFLFLILDYSDGEVARVTQQSSMFGHYLDYLAHFIMFISLMVGLSLRMYFSDPNEVTVIIGLLGSTGILLRGIIELLVSEIILREYYRVNRIFPNSIRNEPYIIENTIRGKVFRDSNISIIRRIARILLYPSGGDSLLVLFIPLTILFYFLSNSIYNPISLYLVKAYYYYLCGVNIVLPFYIIVKKKQSGEIENLYKTVFGSELSERNSKNERN